MPRVTQRALLLLIGLWLLIKCAANPTNYATTALRETQQEPADGLALASQAAHHPPRQARLALPTSLELSFHPVRSPCLTKNADEPTIRLLATFTVQVDNNDTDRLEYRDASNHWVTAWDIPAICRFGIRKRTFTLSSPVSTDAL
jgi:hypothetical protein